MPDGPRARRSRWATSDDRSPIRLNAIGADVDSRPEGPIMPTLPSGLRFEFSDEAVLRPETPFYPCPSGRFWYRDVDPTREWRPDVAGPPERFRLGVVPESRLDATAFVRVLLGDPRGTVPTWRGDWLFGLERPVGFGVADWDALLDHVQTTETIELLDRIVDRCRRQSEALARRDLDHAGLDDFGPALHGRPGTADRLASAVFQARRLGEGMRRSETRGDEASLFSLRSRLEHLAEEADRTLDRYGPHRALAHRALAESHAALGRDCEAIRHARVYAGLVSGDVDFVRDMESRTGQFISPL